MGLASTSKSKRIVLVNRIQKHDGKSNRGSGSDSKIEASRQTKWANFDDLDNINMSKQQSNKTQCAVTHSGLLSKKTY